MRNDAQERKSWMDKGGGGVVCECAVPNRVMHTARWFNSPHIPGGAADRLVRLLGRCVTVGADSPRSERIL